MRFSEVDSLKGLAIIGVIIAHISVEERLDIGTIEIVNNLQAIFGWCVLAFFFSSGILHNNSPDNLNSFTSFAKKRFLRLIIPCLFFSIFYKIILMVIYFTGMFSWSSPVPKNANDVFKFFFVPVGPQFYFLYYLFSVSILVALLRIILSTKVFFVLSAVLFPISYFLLGTPSSAYGADFTLIPMYFFMYIIGHFIAIQNNKTTIYFYALFILPVLISIFISGNLVFGYIFVPFFIWYFFRTFKYISLIFNKINLGSYSSGIYVWHAPLVLPFVSIVCVKFIGSSPIVIFPIILFTVLFCFGISWGTLRVESLKLFRF